MSKFALLLSAICLLFFENHAWGQWVQTGSTGKGDVNALAVNGDNIFAGTSTNYDSGGVGRYDSGGVFLSTNNGTSWANLGPPFMWVNAFAVSGKNVFAAGDGVVLSTNNGASWSVVDTGLRIAISVVSTTVLALAVSGNNILAGTTQYQAFGCSPDPTMLCEYSGHVFLSTNNGASWSVVLSVGMGYVNFSALAVVGNNIFAGASGDLGHTGVYFSTNSGASWIPAVDSGLTDSKVYALTVTNDNIFAGTGSGVFLSTNNGASWTAASTGLPINTWVTCFVLSDSNIFAGTQVSGVYLSRNSGLSWTAINTGLPDKNTNVRSLAVCGNYLFAGTAGNGVWRRPLSEIVSILSHNQCIIPLQTRLRIAASGSLHSGIMLNYSIRSRCIVQLGIYTISGKQVALLEQGERAPGEYVFKFDTGKIPAGFYVCRFQAGSYQESNRLMVVK